MWIYRQSTYVQIFRSYISPNQNIWSQMLSKNCRNSPNRQTKIFVAKRFQHSPDSARFPESGDKFAKMATLVRSSGLTIDLLATGRAMWHIRPYRKEAVCSHKCWMDQKLLQSILVKWTLSLLAALSFPYRVNCGQNYPYLCYTRAPQTMGRDPVCGREM